MITVTKAIKIVGEQTRMLGTEKIRLVDCVGRALAENVSADTDMPPFDRSQMDGYAVMAADTAQAPVLLEIAGESAAGRGWHKNLKSGEAVRIMTGAPVPGGADAVQKLELTSEIDGVVEIREPTQTARYIVGRGTEIRKGETIFRVGETVTENMVAALAAFGYAKVKVRRQPRAAILSTGSEIVEVHTKPGRDQIRNSNSPMLEALCSKFGASTTALPIAGDDIEAITSRIGDAVKQVDILVITGGVSVGKYDHTKEALARLGAETYFDKVRLKPGKPMVFARLGKTLVFGLPGNPVSAAVTFHLFVRYAITTMQGALTAGPCKGFAVLGGDARAAAERDTYLPALLDTSKRGELIASPLKWHGSSDFVGFAMADALIVAARGTVLGTGDVAPILFL